MKDKDTIFLENVYSLILEGKKENLAYLEKLFGNNIDEEFKEKLIKRIINVTKEPNGSPAHVFTLGKMIKEGITNQHAIRQPKIINEILNYYKLYFYLRNRNIPEIESFKNFEDLKNTLDQKQEAIITDKKYVKDKDTKADIKNKTENTPWDYFALCRIIKSNKDENADKNIYNLYDNYLKLKAKVPLVTIETYQHFEIYTTNAIFNQIDTEESKKDIPYLKSYYDQALTEGENLSDVVLNYENYLRVKEQRNGEVEPLEELKNYLTWKEYIHNTSSEKLEKTKGSLGKNYRNEDVLYEDDKIRVWMPKSPHESIAMARDNGQIDYCNNRGSTPWCTTWTKKDRGTNQYFTYRLMDNAYQPWLSTFYYVLFKKYEDQSNPSWFSSIQANKNHKYMYTPAPNGTMANVPWGQMLDDAIKNKYDVSDLKNFDKSKIIKFKPELYFAIQTPSQKKDWDDIKNNPIEYDKFTNLNSYEDVFKHIPLDVEKSAKFRDLNNNFTIAGFNRLNDEEKKEYVLLGYEIHPEMWEYLGDEEKESWLEAGGEMSEEIYSKLSNDEKGKWKANRTSKLITSITDPNAGEPNLNNYDYAIMLNDNNFIQKIIDSKKQGIINGFLDYCSTQNFDMEAHPQILRMILASPKRCKNAIVKQITDGKKLEEVDQRYVEGVKTDETETAELIEFLTQYGTNFGEMPPFLYNLIIASPVHSSKYLMHQLKVDNKNISEIDANLINTAFKHSISITRIGNYLKTTNQLKDLYTHAGVDESVKAHINYFDSKLYDELTAPKQAPVKGNKKAKKEKPKAENDDDSEIDW